ncbi:MAG TPA: hypothetical protein VF185_02690 [Patescibacteria group bacterium]
MSLKINRIFLTATQDFLTGTEDFLTGTEDFLTGTEDFLTGTKDFLTILFFLHKYSLSPSLAKNYIDYL